MTKENKNFVSKTLKSKFLLAATLALSVVACYSRKTTEGTVVNSTLSSPDVRSCGMIVSLGDSPITSGSHPVNLRLQAVACGDDGVDSTNVWQAIGAAADREEVFVQAGSSGTAHAKAVVQGNEVFLIDSSSGLKTAIGTVEEDSYGMPVALKAGVTAEFRYQGVVVPFANLKGTPKDLLEFWMVIGG